jgi:hypothetical protein
MNVTMLASQSSRNAGYESGERFELAERAVMAVAGAS